MKRFGGFPAYISSLAVMLAGCASHRQQSVSAYDEPELPDVSAFAAIQAGELEDLDLILDELGARLAEVEDFFPLAPDLDSLPPARHYEHPYGPGPVDPDLLGHRELQIMFERDHPMVDKWMEYFTTKGRDQYERFYERLQQHGQKLQGWLREEGVPPELVWLAFIESGVNPKAYSRAHAAGIWQFIASTGRLYGLKYDFWVDERRDPELATRAAARHLRDLYKQFNSWELAFSAYNAGGRRVMRAVRYVGSNDYWLMVNNKYALPKETRHYVPKMIAAQRLGLAPAQYGLVVTRPVEAAPPTTAIRVPGGLPIAKMAEKLNLPEATLHDLNRHLRRPISPPDHESFVNVPVAQAQIFTDWIAAGNLPLEQWRADVYVVQSGDTLSGIASQFGTSVAEIKALNQLHSSRIYPRQKLILPGSGKARPIAKAPAQPLSEIPVSDDEKFLLYRVRSGDTLYDLARRFQTTITAIQKANNRRGSQIKAGETLKIPRLSSS